MYDPKYKSEIIPPIKIGFVESHLSMVLACFYYYFLLLVFGSHDGSVDIDN